MKMSIKILKLPLVVFVLAGPVLSIPCSGFLPFGVNLVSFHLPQLPLLLPCLKELACSHVVLVGVDLEQVLPLVEDHLVQRVAPVQGGEGLGPLAIARRIVLEERPWVDVVGGRPEAWLLITMTLPVRRRVPVPEQIRVLDHPALNCSLP